MSEMKQVIANNIIHLRKENKLTQAELAQKLNYSDKAISKWERAESVPDIEILKQIADMFGVTVDYLITENAEQYKSKFKVTKQNKANQITIVALGITMVWLLATMIFVYGHLYFEKSLWTMFVWAIPLSAVVGNVFNMMWGNKKIGFAINTIFVWGLLASLYLQFLTYNLWLIFFIGVPVQIALYLWSKIQRKK